MGHRFAMMLLTHLKLFLLALWLGAAMFFSAVVAPSAFSVLRAFQLPNASEIAGTLVTRTLSVVNVTGFIISLFVLIVVLGFRKGYTRGSRVLEVIVLILVAVSCGVGHWIIAANMRALRVAMVLPIDQVPTQDARRVAFNNLHSYSVAALAIAMILALVAFVLIAYRARLHTN
jgi:hypothetical protein